jgi:DNA ligase
MDETQMTLAVDMAYNHDIDGWLASEKLFGCRAYWDGKEFWTRKGKIIQVPKFWKTKLPKDIHLDGEIFAGRKNFMAAYAATEYGQFTPDVKFVTFDCPSVTGNWLERMEIAKAATKGLDFSYAVDSFVIQSHFHWGFEMMQISKAGGEGVIMRNPAVTKYEIGRSLNYLRFVFSDCKMEMQNRWRLEKAFSPNKKLKTSTSKRSNFTKS